MTAPELYHEAKHRGVLPEGLVRQLAALVSRVLEVDGRENSSYRDEDDRVRAARRIAALKSGSGAVVEEGGRVAFYLVLSGGRALRTKRPLFSFETSRRREVDDVGSADAWRLEDSSDPDLSYNVAVGELSRSL